MATYPFDQPTRAQQPRQPTWEESQADSVSGGTPAGIPAMDVVDNSEELWVFLEIPGFQKDEIQVRGDERTLVVTADRPGELEEGRRVVVRERPRHIERTIQLPAPVDMDSADLFYEDGVCKVVAPKMAAERFTELEFRSGSGT